ncbi:hypothetical protein [uncultured Sulfitobacter sp.]|uniref:hypothetical protein n=1 Tax=uncultured Sulfitobacter sp. TaxID=191468 RepID=UPI002638D448|nr:hypothetical protein [uncultured Sulfitobacter sp.]
MKDTDLPDPIDAVITWVDGTCEAHRHRRMHFMTQTAGPLNENASNPHRWESSDEIYFCLQSIHNNAPWVRYIWIVVEQDGPDLSPLPAALRAKVRIALHAEIFKGHLDVLPTFNSLAIESVMWRIEGLSERFLYFNDDVFLTAKIDPNDMFNGDHPVLRGTWRDYGALVADADARNDPAAFNYFMQINAAALCDVDAGRVFAAAHVVHPLRRSVMAHLFERHCDVFATNIAHRFRDISQFLPQGVHNHHCIAEGQAVLADRADALHIKSGQGAGEDPQKTRQLLQKKALAQVKFLCVNDLPQLEALVPDARALINDAIGGGVDLTALAPQR